MQEFEAMKQPEKEDDCQETGAFRDELPSSTEEFEGSGRLKLAGRPPIDAV